MKILWSKNSSSKRVFDALEILSRRYDIKEVSTTPNVVFIESELEGLKITKEKNQFNIYFNELRYALRGCLKLLTCDDLNSYEEKTVVKEFRMMLDNSRNAVHTLEKTKEMIEKIAILGYTSFMPYLEDMYEIPEYPAFGYMRGRYSKSELKEMNDHGKKLGVKVIPCIQTLGHMQQIFHWKYFDHVKDAGANLLVGHEETYKLIDAMLKNLKECFDSDEIAIGMDEVHSLGKGKHIDVFGYEPQPTIFIRHLKEMDKLCTKYGYKNPFIWSDMLIKMFSEKHSYYDLDVKIPQSFKNEIPSNLKLGYWDYDSTDLEKLEKMIDIHKEFNRPFALVTGLTTWFTTDYKHWSSKFVLDTFAKVCETKQVEDFLLTIWGDDGAYCDPDSYTLGYFYLAEKIYAKTVDKEKYNRLYGFDYDKLEMLSQIESRMGNDGFINDTGKVYPGFASIFFDDPIMGIGMNNELRHSESRLEDAYMLYSTIYKNLENDTDSIYAYPYLAAKICAKKIEVRKILVKGYFENSHDLLKSTYAIYDELICLTKLFEQEFKAMWQRNFKTYGMDVMQVRLAGFIRRYEEAKLYIEDYINGKYKKIEELEEMKKEIKPVKIKPFYQNIAVATIVR